jgi:hypothetical protein
MRWAGNLARAGDRRAVDRVLVRRIDDKKQLGRRRLNGRILLKLLFSKWHEGMQWIDLAPKRDK